jgi:SAM-dependent methyltransferase
MAEPSESTAAPVLFDRALLLARQARARKLGAATFLLDRVADDFEERMRAVLRDFSNAADLWTPGELLRGPIRNRFKNVVHVGLEGGLRETLPLQAESLDLVVSALAFQFVNDLPGVLAQIRRALKPDGLLLAAMIGGDTLTELRDVGGLLQRAGFALPVIDLDRVVARYDNPFVLMADLRRMGATNNLLERRRTPTRRATLLRMAQIYAERFADPDGRIRATFDVIRLSGWAPHESQPKPLKPGSATASLEAAVKRTQK